MSSSTDGLTLVVEDMAKGKARLLSDPTIKDVYVDLGYSGVDHQNPTDSIKHRGKYNRLSDKERSLFKRRQADEPIIGHLKSNRRLNRYHLKALMAFR